MKKIPTIAISFIAGLILGAAAFTSADWNDATANPPGDNAPGPLNVGDNQQTKPGSLVLNTSSNPFITALYVGNGRISVGIPVPTLSTTADYINWPDNSVYMKGQVMISGGNPAPGKVLTAVDTRGLAEWKIIPPGVSSNGLSKLRAGAPGCNNILTLQNTCYTYAVDTCTGGGCNSEYKTCNGTGKISGALPRLCYTYPIDDPCLLEAVGSGRECVWDAQPNLPPPECGVNRFCN